ncbi:glycosyltransferase [Pseudarthrobacter sp. NBSH8]|uniref:glycosyltransferase n=1 Tax=Pseudarthrobacter sp. NBSH8 TaxID=2596911 RepID=UPI001628ACF3|nr:glycosyltransferase [Pseudarthrobacter sp. NBSH8]QNE16223.1 glycosyltransferase [Pseudarthrobacter sp. NBSH8]
MKLLYITESVPNRDPMLGDGSSMIPFEVLRNLPADIAVTLLTFAGPVDVPAEIRTRCNTVHVMPTRRRGWAAILSLGGLTGFGKHQRSTAKAHTTAAKLSAAHEATLIHGPHALFLAHSVTGPLVLQTVDPWSIRAAMETSVAHALWPAYRFREFLAVRSERRLPPRARLLTVGAQDAVSWSEHLARPARSIPNGAERSTRRASTAGSPVACFVGSLNYGPNVDSVGVLINKIAPLVWQQVPDARFVLAGRRPAPSVRALAGPRVDVLANVPSVLEVFHSADVAVFPDEHGVGIRNSVREALAAGLPVVATPVAAREQAAHPLLTVAPDPQEFADHIVRRLTTRGWHRPGADEASLRTWRTVAQEYADEIGKAIKSDSAGILHGRSPA